MYISMHGQDLDITFFFIHITIKNEGWEKGEWV